MNTSARPFFSVLIAVHNRRDLLLRALRSVTGQSEQDYEIVLVDDGSTDGTLDAAERFLSANDTRAVTLRLAEQSGIPAARNACLKLASGEIAAFLDSDDIWHPRYLSLQRSAFSPSPRPIFAFTDYLSDGPAFSGPVRQFKDAPSGFDPIVGMLTKPFVHTMSCFAAPLKAIRAIGGFTESLRRFSDLDLYVRLLGAPTPNGKLAWQTQPMIYIPQIAVLKLIHLNDRDLTDYRRQWEAGKKDFLDLAFSYPSMRGRAVLRGMCEAALAEGQRRLFLNFESDSRQ